MVGINNFSILSFYEKCLLQPLRQGFIIFTGFGRYSVRITDRQNSGNPEVFVSTKNPTDISYFGITTYYKIECGSNAKALSVLAQNSFGQMDYKIGETVKLKMDVNSLVGFLE